MSDASQDIVAIEPPVKRDGFPVIPKEVGHGFLKTTVTHPLLLAVFDEIESKNPKNQNEVTKKVSGNYGKRELAAVAAFLPWRGSPVSHP